MWTLSQKKRASNSNAIFLHGYYPTSTFLFENGKFLFLFFFFLKKVNFFRKKKNPTPSFKLLLNNASLKLLIKTISIKLPINCQSFSFGQWGG
jgi:hypothetical protein